ncbi:MULTISPECIES: aminoacyl-tRNA hydrolase [Legionella]|uniref:aminoacyl-tRNA hydrolase n=1 Tax=Legionella TaxID=445 RepID=UPI000F8EBC9A|nr:MULTISPECIES: aminoacyl-tRNA hydrolase [Legionella]MCP0913059.1 aminoacyl-tRNA hydrolase [Legionella sp. 27cVA30]RUQ98485.1 aminoacyl-tRNA hydrolase [Legionella septentrionalis]RUR14598.1 aminoacyl-tRNA hydrolase [Legionella septentrionalis]
MSIKLIIGLRNPGATYAHTRHNAGGWFAQLLAEAHQSAFKTEKKLQSDVVHLSGNHGFCKIALPLTYMNHSGLCVRALCQFYRIEPQEILVAHDELDLPPGRLKLKTGGGHGGHNGLRDIINQLGSSNFHRLRIGIGHPGHKDLVLNYVLGKPSQHDRQLIMDAIERAVTAVPHVLSGNMAMAMNLLNG